MDWELNSWNRGGTTIYTFYYKSNPVGSIELDTDNRKQKDLLYNFLDSLNNLNTETAPLVITTMKKT